MLTSLSCASPTPLPHSKLLESRNDGHLGNRLFLEPGVQCLLNQWRIGSRDTGKSWQDKLRTSHPVMAGARSPGPPRNMPYTCSRLAVSPWPGLDLPARLTMASPREDGKYPTRSLPVLLSWIQPFQRPSGCCSRTWPDKVRGARLGGTPLWVKWMGGLGPPSSCQVLGAASQAPLSPAPAAPDRPYCDDVPSFHVEAGQVVVVAVILGRPDLQGRRGLWGHRRWQTPPVL